MKNTSEYAEPEIVGESKRKRAARAGRKMAGQAARQGSKQFAKSAAGRFAAGFVVNEAVGRVTGFKRRIFLVIALYTAGVVLGIIGLLSLLGWALFSLLPNGLATVVLGIIIAPIVFGIYITVMLARNVINHPLAKDIKNIK